MGSHGTLDLTIKSNIEPSLWSLALRLQKDVQSDSWSDWESELRVSRVRRISLPYVVLSEHLYCLYMHCRRQLLFEGLSYRYSE